MINEEIAKRAWDNVHMDDYAKNSDTEMWKNYCSRAKEIIFKNEYMTSEEKIKAYEKYKSKIAEWINKRNSNNANHCSVMICGAGNYNMKKHNKFLEREYNLMKQFDYIFDVNNYIRKAKIKNETKQDIEQKEYMLNDDIKVIQNTELNRLMLLFDYKPNEEVREVLKSNGFKWSPKNQAWQRQLTTNALISLKIIKEKII